MKKHIIQAEINTAAVAKAVCMIRKSIVQYA